MTLKVGTIMPILCVWRLKLTIFDINHYYLEGYHLWSLLFGGIRVLGSGVQYNYGEPRCDGA